MNGHFESFMLWLCSWLLSNTIVLLREACGSSLLFTLVRFCVYTSLPVCFFSGSINNIHKVYKEKDSVVEALRGESQTLPFEVSM